MEWDVFISHASEDKREVASPLAALLIKAGLSVWLDENELKLGDSLRIKIDHGLAKSRYGIVILSKAFFSKDWPQRELNSLVARESNSQKIVLPIWHKIDWDFVAGYSPLLADRFAVSTEIGLERVASKVVQVIRNEPNSSLELISYDLLTNNFVTLGMAKWTPRTLQLGLAWKVLTEDSGHIKFSEHFIKIICEISREWVTSHLGRFLTKDWLYEQIILAIIRAAPPNAAPKTDGLLYFASNISLHLIDYIFEVGRTAQVVEGYVGGKFELHREFMQEVREIIELRVNEISSTKKVRPFILHTLIEVVKTHLILYDKGNITHNHLLAGIVAFLFYKDMIRELENIFRKEKKRTQTKNTP